MDPMNPASPVFDPHATARVYGFDDVRSYQDWHGLLPDGLAGPITTASMLAPRCGCPDYQEARGNQASWPRRCMDVSTAYELPGLNLTPEQIASAWKTATSLWSGACGISLATIDDIDKAQIWAKSKPLPGSTLAWSYLPNGRCRERLEQRYDTTVDWNHDFLAKTMLHELGHALGLTHSNNRADIMFPRIVDRPLLSYPSTNDRARVVNLYGQPVPDDNTPEPPAGPTESRITVTGGPLQSGTYSLIKL